MRLHLLLLLGCRFGLPFWCLTPKGERCELWELGGYGVSWENSWSFDVVYMHDTLFTSSTFVWCLTHKLYDMLSMFVNDGVYYVFTYYVATSRSVLVHGFHFILIWTRNLCFVCAYTYYSITWLFLSNLLSITNHLHYWQKTNKLLSHSCRVVINHQKGGDWKHLGPWLVLVINDNIRLYVTNVCFAEEMVS
jgi:hypothetical protein